jgi:hypothetical protein
LALEEKFIEAKAELIERLDCARGIKKEKFPEESFDRNFIDELEEEFERKQRIRAKLVCNFLLFF